MSETETSSQRFDISKVQYNPMGWGPSSIPPQFKDMPYQPFSKSDRLGKISDWTGNTYSDRRHVMKYNSQFGAGGTTYAYYHEEDENSFQLVDTSRMTRPLYGRGRYFRGRGGGGGMNNFRSGGGNMRWANNKNNMGGGGSGGGLQVLSKAQMNKERERIRQVRKWQRGRQNYNKPVQIKQRESSVTVKGDWTVIEEIEKVQLGKLSLPTVEEPEDLLRCGTLEFYNKVYDRVNVKNEKPLKRINRVFHTVTTTDDPVIRKLSKSHPEANVFATDIILATLMCANRSVYSWDIVVQKIGDKIFLDKRDNTEFGLLTVSETAAEPPQDETGSLNSPQNLALEATFINHNFSQQVLKPESESKVHKFEEENPFWSPDEEGEVASVGYRYRMWTLGNNIRLIARCEHDAVIQGPNNEIQYMNIKALNEWDSKHSGNVDWRQKLDTQRGAVLANELKHNACKLAKWTVQALLVGSDLLKFGYISRYNVKDTSRHVILGTQHFKPSEFANQINLSMDNAWGIVRCIVDLVMAQKDGKYLIVKDPNKPVLRLYDIPDNTFESEEDTDESDEEGDGLEIPLKA
eukprot:TRINITY_DN390_c0_g1_i2.p1 TRINITY_DN390_c0_g1~~TRINITY_DN390_c0_g1_i2.p1  ORF type:complete len:576 (-),score=220.15 TRINITY_DN390_c0_g1_i2:278-2005(-)